MAFSLISRILLLLQALGILCSWSNSKSPQVSLKNGTYAGYHVPQVSQDVFLGIPFAKAERFRVAASLTDTWTGTRDTTRFGLACVGYWANLALGAENMGDDCLNLNIVRPSGSNSKSKLPVMVWIYGGGLNSGSNRAQFKSSNISILVQPSVDIGIPVIAVSINYRLSAFGWLWSEQIASEGITNLGLRDQWKALEWIKENIQAFGGDPSRVTLYGESGGSLSISLLTIAYGGNHRGLFHRAILASGPHFGLGPGDPPTAQNAFNTLANSTGCYYENDAIQCLRDIPLSSLNSTILSTGITYGEAPGPSRLGWMVDGDIIRNSPYNAFFQHSKPLLAPVDIIVGATSDEGIGVTPVTDINTDDELATTVATFFGLNLTQANELISLYPIDAAAPPYSVPMTFDWPAFSDQAGIPAGNQTRRAYAIFGDISVIAGSRLTALSWSRLMPNQKIYQYRFDTAVQQTANSFATHGSDVPFIFGGAPLPAVPAIQKLSYAMQALFISFAARGNPNRHGLRWIPEWPEYDARSGGVNMVFNATMDNVLNLHVEEDNFREAGIKWINDRQLLLSKQLQSRW